MTALVAMTLEHELQRERPSVRITSAPALVGGWELRLWVSREATPGKRTCFGVVWQSGGWRVWSAYGNEIYASGQSLNMRSALKKVLAYAEEAGWELLVDDPGHVR